MASAGSVFNSPETRTTLDSFPPNNSPEALKNCLPPPPRFHLSPSGATSELWGNAMTQLSPHSLLQAPSWDRENSFYHSLENPQSAGQLNGHNVPLHHRSLRDVDRGISSYAPSGLASRRSFADLAAELENVLTLQPPRQSTGHNLDAFNSQSMPPSQHDSSSNSPSAAPQWSATPTRHLVITLPSEIEVSALKQFLRDIGDLKNFIHRRNGNEDLCIASFFDSRFASVALKRIHMEHVCTAQYCSPAYVASVLGHHIPTNEGQVICHVSTAGGPVTHTITEISNRVFKLMTDYGPTVSFEVLAETPMPTFLTTFYDTRIADQAVAQLDGQYVESIFIRASIHEPGWNRLSSYSGAHRSCSPPDFSDDICHMDDIYSPTPRPYRLPLEKMARSHSNTLLHKSAGYSPFESREESGLDHYHPGNQYSRATQPSLHPYRSQIMRSESAHQLARWEQDTDDFAEMYRLRPRDPRELRTPTNRVGSWGTVESPSNRRLDAFHHGTNKNTVDLERIQQGLDTRTTVMLRNIPNKVDQQNLKEFIDSTSALKYNFLYLRIDFKNMCNVGYAFINFIDPFDIIPFVLAKSGKRWNKYNSDKVLDVTYANIQGIDQLVEKFRNSSVMDQPEAYRPKLYYSAGPNIGQEMTFPESNNPNRKLRSVTAAQHIGLFAPKINSSGKVWRKRD